MERLKKLKDYLYNEVYEQYGWLPLEDDYSEVSKVDYYKENFIKQFKDIYGKNINENSQTEKDEFYFIIEKVQNI